MRCYREKPFAHKSLSIGSGRQNIRMCIVYVCFIYIYIIFNIQKVLGRNYTFAPAPWRVLGRKSLLPLWSRRLCDRDRITGPNGSGVSTRLPPSLSKVLVTCTIVTTQCDTMYTQCIHNVYT